MYFDLGLEVDLIFNEIDQHLNLALIISVPIRNVEAVLGGIAELPCDVTPEDVHDDVYLILWFKDEASKPMYRYENILNK